ITRSAIRSLSEGESLPRSADEQRIDLPPVFIVAADESQRMQGEKLAQALKEQGINAQGVDVIAAAKDAKLMAPPNLEIRYSKRAKEEPYFAGLVEMVKKFTGEEPKLVDVSTDLDPRTYEIWFSKH
ncbi:MAG TPA: hypothetical protein VE242_03415, partial [Chthoniobacterales bacterium]|nr:hypothetical protein [Chthoniobacterales bacterium]